MKKYIYYYNKTNTLKYKNIIFWILINKNNITKAGFNIFIQNHNINFIYYKSIIIIIIESFI